MSFRELKIRAGCAPFRKGGVQVISPFSNCQRVFGCEFSGAPGTCSDSSGSLLLADCSQLAARRAKAVVFVPRGSLRPEWVSEGLDVVFCHHSLQLPHSAWKDMRGRLRWEGDRTVSLRDLDMDAEGPVCYPEDPSADVIVLAQHARTLVFTGSEAAFECLARRYRWLSTCQDTGGHFHLFGMMRGGALDARNDLTAMYVRSEDWQ